MGPYILYAAPLSLYSGKARSYLRKHGIERVERSVGDPRFGQEILPQIGRLIMPVLETPQGEIVQDTVDIIDHFETTVAPERSAYPGTATQRVVAHLLDMFGGEGMLRPAMHYRWNFDEVNMPFISDELATALAPAGDRDVREQVFAWASGALREAATAVGVTERSVPEIERSYEEFLALLNAHLETAPYLLGGRPTIGDFGFMGPLYAHLARDPQPSLIMKRRAGRVWRWVERMNSPSLDAGEYLDYPQQLFADDEIPATLRALMAYIGEEHVAEMLSQVSFMDDWFAEHEESVEGEVFAYDVAKRFLGMATFEWRGQEMSVGVGPYRMLMLQRLQDAFAACSEHERHAVRGLFRSVGLEPLLDARPRRRVARAGNREVWGALQEASLSV
jgi:glutathione S-transferase